MGIKPKPLTRQQTKALRKQAAVPGGQLLGFNGTRYTLADLVASHDWHRARVQVTDDDIRAAGLGDPDVCVECPRLFAWIAANGMHVVDRANDTVGIGPGGGRWVHGIWAERPDWDAQSIADGRIRLLLHRGSPMAHDHIINALAKAVGRAPLDVLAEIAAMEVSDG